MQIDNLGNPLHIAWNECGHKLTLETLILIQNYEQKTHVVFVSIPAD